MADGTHEAMAVRRVCRRRDPPCLKSRGRERVHEEDLEVLDHDLAIRTRCPTDTHPLDGGRAPSRA